MKVIETIKPAAEYDCCGKAPVCPCFHKLRSKRLYDYCQAVLADEKTTADSSSRAESIKIFNKIGPSDIVDKNENIAKQQAALPVTDVTKVPCARCIRLYKIIQDISQRDETAILGLCDHCLRKSKKHLQLQLEQNKKYGKQNEYTSRISDSEHKDTMISSRTHRDKNILNKNQIKEMLQLLKRDSLSEINIALGVSDVDYKHKKLMSHSKSHFLETEKNVNFKTSLELIELYQSSSFRPLSNATISEKNISEFEVRSEYPKVEQQYLKVDKTGIVHSMKPKSEPTLIAEGREHKLVQYKKLLESDVKPIGGYDKGMAYYFPKASLGDIIRHVSSSELLKKTRKKFGEHEKKNLELEGKERLKNKKRRLEDEKRRRALERQQKGAEDNKKARDKAKTAQKSAEPKASSKEPKQFKGTEQAKQLKISKEPKQHVSGSVEPTEPIKKDAISLPKLSKNTVQRAAEDINKDEEIAKLIKALKEKREQDKIELAAILREPAEKPGKRRKKRPKSSQGPKITTPESTIESVKGGRAKIDDIIISERIYKNKPSALPPDPFLQGVGEEIIPMLFKNKHSDEGLEVAITPDTSGVKVIPETKTDKNIKGIIQYALSDRSFIEKGWTVLPVEKVVRKMNVYRMRPARPQFDWFEHNKNKHLMTYDSGDKLAEIDDNGRGRWYYRNGRLALDYYDAEEANAQQRYVVYSNGKPDERGRSRPLTVLATFDHLGNGVVFDHTGKIRLKYNQTDGIVLDRGIGPVTHWKWHTLNDPPVLQQVMIDTQMPHKDPAILKMGEPSEFKKRQDNEEMLAIEFDNFIKEKSKKMSQSFKPFQIRMKALKINEHFSLKVLDQANIYLIYRDGSTVMKQNIGMILDPQEIVDTDIADLGIVASNMERFPARSDSIAGLQRSVAQAYHFEKSRLERHHMLRPPVPVISTDILTAAQSKPLLPKLKTISGLRSPFMGGPNYCKCSRKPPINNKYYNSRLV